jgi:hypothetical protein
MVHAAQAPNNDSELCKPGNEACTILASTKAVSENWTPVGIITPSFMLLQS